MTLNTKQEILTSCDIFSQLQPDEIKALSDLTEVVTLEENQALFYRDDASRDAYVVISGKLLATTATAHTPGKFIGYIHPNEIVGEMSLLTEMPRSLSIFAATHTQLLMIRQPDFQHLCYHNPEVAFKMLEIIIKRTQGVIKQLNNAQTTKFIALLPTSDSINLAALIHHFQQFSQHSDKVIVLNEKELPQKSDEISHLLLTLREKANYIIYPVSSHDTERQEILLHFADKTVLLAKANQDPEENLFWEQCIQHQFTYDKDQLELALLYTNTNEKPQNTKQWLDKAPFFRHHHVYLDKLDDIKRLFRYVTGSATGLVLGGGGMKGWAHVGAIKALQEANIPIDAIGGTSVGAGVGACYLLSDSFDEMREKFNRLCSATMKSFTSLRELTWPLISLFSGKSGTLSAQEELNHPIEDLIRPFFCISCNITRKEQAIHSQGSLWENTRASASLPGLVPPLIKNNELHVDGGVVNNLPVNVMADFLENSGTIIAVSITNLARPPGTYSFSPIISLRDSILFKLGLKKEYRFPSLFYTFIDSLLMGSHSQQKLNMQRADVLVQPDLNPYGGLDTKSPIDQIIHMGYLATQEALRARALV